MQCDNAAFLASCLKDGSLAGKIDLIYCDPPFFTCGGFDAAVKVALSNGDVYKLHVGAYDDYSYSEMDKYLTDLMYIHPLHPARTGLWQRTSAQLKNPEKRRADF